MNELVWLFFVLGIEVGVLIGFLLTVFCGSILKGGSNNAT